MPAVIGALIFFLGLALGSFSNCLVYRLNEGKSLRGRSYCPKCKKQLLWHDNIPLASFIFLKGKCRFCHSPIGVHYPLVELSTGVLSLIVYRFSITNQISNFASPPPRWPNGLLEGVFYLLITWALIAIFLSDLKYRTIPDQIVYPAMALVIILHLRGVSPPSAGPLHLGGVLLSGLGAALFFGLLVLVTRGKGMGLGDVKLAGLMGLFLGFPQIVVALYLAFLTGATVGVILILLGKKKFRSQISFGPFLVVVTFIAWFWGEKIIKILGF